MHVSLEGTRQRAELTSRFNEGKITFSCQQRVWQVTEELLEQAGHTVDIVEEVFGIPEVKITG